MFMAFFKTFLSCAVSFSFKSIFVMATLQAMVVNQNSGPSSGSRGPDAVAGFYGGKFFFGVLFTHNIVIICTTQIFSSHQRLTQIIDSYQRLTPIVGSHQRLKVHHDVHTTSCQKLVQPCSGSRSSMELCEVCRGAGP